MNEENFWSTMGHTYEDHVAVDIDDLKERLVLEKYDVGTYDEDKKSSIASRFLSEDLARKAIKASLKKKSSVIDDWMKLQYDSRLVLKINFMRQIGEGVAKGTNWNTIYPMYSVIIVLKADCHFRSYEVVTAYPAANNAVMKQIIKDRATWYANRKKH